MRAQQVVKATGDGPSLWKTRKAAEIATLHWWVFWFNEHRLLEPPGYLPPAEFEANYYRKLEQSMSD